ncbi:MULTISPECIES: sulfurtransferase [unclassified Corynebacterium]|uniref:sulfurtransferase n=1 Tax=unclassified Corynebacterium TaxID=2624378 RepID=UPI0029CA1987|nr:MULTISPECIES: rhodanese-like domain-containing protein [unclassified Corynebacterium]WPF67136.1 rhodanese-like domain-containing protein [Corynebacterium sp. 22KM0430]WPF69624.1 rhodanese-like domain-containing protein [Corynebacterium sp. 21KM1197]
MAAIIDVEQCASLRGKAVLLYATRNPGEAIPGSLVMDAQDQVDDPREYFERVGVSDDTPVVIYGELAAYVWWLAKVAGLNNVAVLDGGMAAWVASGRKPGELGQPKRRGTIKAEVAWERIAERPESDGYVTTVEVDDPEALVNAEGYYSEDPRAEIEKRAGDARALIFSGEHACVGALAATVAGYGDVRVLL